MKRILSLIIVITLVLCCIFSLTACTETPDIIGKWSSSIDLSGALNKALAQDEATAQYVKVSDFSLDIQAEFKENGTYTLSIDEDSLKETMETAEVEIRKGIENYLAAYLSSMNLNISLEDAFGDNSTTIDQMVNDVFSNELVESIVGNFKAEGNYKAKDGKLHLSISTKHAVDNDVYHEYSVSKTLLTLSQGTVEGADELDIYPIVFSRVE